ncbi:MAG: hypothetical protein M1819_004701 [Sarea resinae]|nr:MAG: hypothetical protein M1819_004701 [Sarea resinae]
MFLHLLLILLLIAIFGTVEGKTCTNLTIPVQISARTGIFNIPTLASNLDAVAFSLNVTNIQGNFSQTSLLGYRTTTGEYNISAKLCQPEKANASTREVVQFLTHGIGFDKTYWDLPFNNYNYSYIDVAVDQFGFSTLSIDRLGIGNSSTGDALNTIQAQSELSAIYEITKMLRQGTLPGTPESFKKVVHVGHSFGSALSYSLANQYPNETDGLILTGFSLNGTWLPATVAGWNSKIASLDQPLRFGNVSAQTLQYLSSKVGNNATYTAITQIFKDLGLSYSTLKQLATTSDILDFLAGANSTPPVVPANLPTGYLTWSDITANLYAFLAPRYFDPAVLTYAETHKQPYTLGEVLTLPSVPASAPEFKGPVQIVTGNQDAIYCGGDCFSTGVSDITSIPAAAKKSFPHASVFETLIQPNTGHALNIHYNSTAAFVAIQKFVKAHVCA